MGSMIASELVDAEIALLKFMASPADEIAKHADGAASVYIDGARDPITFEPIVWLSLRCPRCQRPTPVRRLPRHPNWWRHQVRVSTLYAGSAKAPVKCPWCKSLGCMYLSAAYRGGAAPGFLVTWDLYMYKAA